jgi:hypothetical protein
LSPRGPAAVQARRRLAHLFGLRAETIAAILLTLKGYSILARRYAVNGGEIDLPKGPRHRVRRGQGAQRS